MKKTKIIVILCMFSFSGCMSSGNTVLKNENEQTITQKIIEGKTTQSQIQSMFGSPISKSFTDGGLEIWEYSFTEQRLTTTSYIPLVSVFSSGSKGKTKELRILFDKNSIVKKYTMADSDVETKTGILR